MSTISDKASLACGYAMARCDAGGETDAVAQSAVVSAFATQYLTEAVRVEGLDGDDGQLPSLRGAWERFEESGRKTIFKAGAPESGGA